MLVWRAKTWDGNRKRCLIWYCTETKDKRCFSGFWMLFYLDGVGGIVGTSEGGTINNCYNSGNVEGAEFVGGNGGASNGGAIYDYIGGIAGKNYSKNDGE